LIHTLHPYAKTEAKSRGYQYSGQVLVSLLAKADINPYIACGTGSVEAGTSIGLTYNH
jgi:hypothetical protein